MPSIRFGYFLATLYLLLPKVFQSLPRLLAAFSSLSPDFPSLCSKKRPRISRAL
jgi:hypothetical protein